MQASNTQKLLWNDQKFSKLSSFAGGITSVFGVKMLEQAGIPQYPAARHLSVLDNACGTGVVTASLHQMLQNRPSDSFEITCGDLADAMLDSVKQRVTNAGWSNTKVLKVDAQDTKLPSAHYTHVFTNFGPMLFPDAPAMLSECHRMLMAHGVCAFTTWKKVGWVDDFREAFDSMPDLPSFPTDEKIASAFSKGRWTDEDYISDILGEHGFDNIKIEALKNTTIIQNEEQLRDTIIPIIAIVYRFWTDEERQQYANEKTDARIEKWFSDRSQGQPVSWDWVALVTTSNKSEQ